MTSFASRARCRSKAIEADIISPDAIIQHLCPIHLCRSIFLPYFLSYCSGALRMRLPWGFAILPEFVEIVAISLSVHALPNPFMLKHFQLPVIRQPREWLLFQDAKGICGQIVQEAPAQEEIAPVDPIPPKLRLLSEFNDRF